MSEHTSAAYRLLLDAKDWQIAIAQEQIDELEWRLEWRACVDDYNKHLELKVCIEATLLP